MLQRLLDRINRDPMPGIASRPPLWHPGFPFVLLWSHKSGSTALAHWFFAQIGSPQLRTDAPGAYSGLGIHRYQFKVYCRAPGYLRNCARLMRSGYPVIKFVRDPAARAFSGFLSARRREVLSKPQFWGARVNRDVLGHVAPGADNPGHAYSFADFVEWLAATPPERLNNHVRMQYSEFESLPSIEVCPIEGLEGELARIEKRFGLQSLATKPGLLESGHHRIKSGSLEGNLLEAALHEPVPVGYFESHMPPLVDSTRLAGSELGARLREVFAIDYRACRIY